MEDKETKQPSQPAENAVIWANELTRSFETEIAVDSLDMEIPPGTIFGFVGPSGCGKTTTVRLLTGYYSPTSGEISVLGERPDRFSRAAREKIGYMNQQFVLYPELTVWENMNFAASMYGVGLRRKKRFDELLDFVELAGHEKKRAGQLSGGMKRRLSLAATLVHTPELLFLDEPTTGIDPILRRKFWDYFKDLQKEGRTLFITTQYVGEAAYCDLVGVMLKGRLLAVDTPEGLMRRAYGGDIVRLRTVVRIDYARRQQINQLPFTADRLNAIGDNEIEIIVEDAADAMPVLIDICNKEDLEIETIEKISPPLDDVFVKLIEEAGNV